MHKKCFTLTILLICILNAGCQKSLQTGENTDIISPTQYEKRITPIVIPTQGSDAISLTQSIEKITPIIMPTQVPAESLEFNNELIQFLRNTTTIPIYLPNAWRPMKQQDSTQNYYLGASGDSNSYYIDVYTTTVAVKVNDEDLLEKNGPVSEADYIGSIYGKKSDTQEEVYDIPENTKEYELIPGITVYGRPFQAWWEERGWKFILLVGSYEVPDFPDYLKDLASAWLNAERLVAEAGKVKIVEGNRLTFYYYWEQDGCQYEYVTHSSDYEETIKILNSFTRVDQNQK